MQKCPTALASPTLLPTGQHKGVASASVVGGSRSPLPLVCHCHSVQTTLFAWLKISQTAYAPELSNCTIDDASDNVLKIYWQSKLSDHEHLSSKFARSRQPNMCERLILSLSLCLLAVNNGPL